MDLKVFKLAANTKNHKLLKDYDYVLRQKNTFCGDEITISIKAKSKKVYKIGYSCKSCIYTQASASLLSEFFKNKSFKEINDIILELNKFCKKQTPKLPKRLSALNKIINGNNLARKDCLLLPFITVKKMIKNL